MTGPLFVVGCHRSGTTVLRRILNTHPSIWLAKETQYLAFRQWRPDDWHRVRSTEEMLAHLEDVAPFLPPTGWDREPTLETFIAGGSPLTFAAFYQYLCQLEAPANRQLRYWGDNTPRYVSLIPQLHRAWPEARFLHLVRDPRDVVRSSLAVWFGGNTALTAAEEWVERVGAGLAGQQLVGSNLRVVRFEDLVRDPQATLAGIARWLGLDPNFSVDDPGPDGVQVARQAHLRRIAEPLDPAVIGRWRHTLTAAQVAEIEQLCQPFLSAFGYELGTWQPSWNPTPRFARFASHYAQSWAINVGRGVWRRFAHSRSSK